jgi:hypothetical protein
VQNHNLTLINRFLFEKRLSFAFIKSLSNMIKNFFFLFCCCATLGVQSQTVVYSIGRNYNRFVPIEQNIRQMNNVYTPAFGNSLEINFQSIPHGKYTFGFALCVDQYGGGLQITSSGGGGSSQTELTTTKTIVGLALYPLDFKWGKHWHFQLGGLLSRLVHEQTRGFRQTSVPGAAVSSHTLFGGNNIQVNNSYNMGVITSIAYAWEFKKDWSLVPKYSFYGSFTDDFIGIPVITRAVRHSLSIGISKRLTE